MLEALPVLRRVARGGRVYWRQYQQLEGSARDAAETATGRERRTLDILLLCVWAGGLVAALMLALTFAVLLAGYELTPAGKLVRNMGYVGGLTMWWGAWTFRWLLGYALLDDARAQAKTAAAHE